MFSAMHAIAKTTTSVAEVTPSPIELSATGVIDFSGTYDDYLRSQGVVF